jgi:hypothetical protein
MHALGCNPLVVEDKRAPIFKGLKRMTFGLKLMTALWLAIVMGGAILLEFHAKKPGQQDEAPAKWPMSSGITPNSTGATLLVFVHPYCPCARTTLGELAAIMTRCRNQVTAHVLFVVAGDENPNWAKNELWQTAGAIPGVRAVVDAKAMEAAKFGVRTSGHTVLFDEHGICLFAGGITVSRGHAGDNIGRQAIVSYLTKGKPETHRAPTFGCPLFVAESTVTSEDNL